MDNDKDKSINDHQKVPDKDNPVDNQRPFPVDGSRIVDVHYLLEHIDRGCINCSLISTLFHFEKLIIRITERRVNLIKMVIIKWYHK